MKKLFILILLISTSMLMAQENQKTKEAVELSLEDLLTIEVVTAGRTAQSLSDAPATLMVITDKQIEERGYRDLKDIFRDLPGVDISENNAGEVRTLVISRGILRNNKLMVLLDGKKLNSPGGELFVYGNNIPLHNIKQIEIIYGPSSAMYGADAYAGVINMISKKPEDFYRGDVSVFVGSDSLKDVSFNLTGFHSSFSYILSGRYYDSSGINVMDTFTPDEIFREPEYYSQFNSSYDQPVTDVNLYGKIYFGNFTMGFSHMDADEPNGQTTDGTQNGFTYMYNDSNRWHQKMNMFYMEHVMSEGESYTLTSNLVYSDYELGTESGWIYSWGPQYKYAKTTSIKLEEVLNVSFSEKTQLTAGFMVEQVNCFPKTNNLNSLFEGNELIDFVDYPDDPSLPDEYRGQTISFGSFDYRNLGVFGEITQTLTDHLQFNIGIRYDHNTDYGESVNPRMGLIWKVDDKTNIKFLYGEAYIAPSKYVAYEHWSAGGIFGYYPNPDLEPEELKSYSVNFQRVFTDTFSVTLNLYNNELENLITSEGYPWIRNVNGGEAETKGFELMLNYHTKTLQIYVSYSYLDAENVDGTPIPKVSDNKLNAGLSYTYNRWTISPRLRWVSDIAKIPSPGYDESDTMDGHTVIDCSIRGKNVILNLDVSLHIYNITDEKYFAASPYGEGPDGWIMDKNPQPGINGYLGVTYRF